MPREAAAQGVPESLGIHVSMGVDEARGHDMALGVNRLFGSIPQFADRGDLATGDADIGAIAGQARAVDDGAIPDNEIVVHHASFFSADGEGRTLSLASLPLLGF